MVLSGPIGKFIVLAIMKTYKVKKYLMNNLVKIKSEILFLQNMPYS